MFQSIKRYFNDIHDGDHNISHYQIELNLWDHTNKKFGLELINWACEISIGFGFDEILLGLGNHAST